MPKHLSSDQVIAYLEQKKVEKQREDDKLKRKQEREEEKECEEAKRRRGGSSLREKRRKQKQFRTGTDNQDVDKEGPTKRARKRERSRKRSNTELGRGQEDSEPSSLISSDSDSPGKSLNNCKDAYECPVCGLPENGVDPWIAYDTCNRWYHIACSCVDPDCDLDELDWKCSECL